MRVVVIVALLVGVGCKKDKPAVEHEEPPPPANTYNPYKNVMPQKVKADVEKIQQQHEDKLDKDIESAKSQQ